MGIDQIAPTESVVGKAGKKGLLIGLGTPFLFWFLISTFGNFPQYSLDGYFLCPAQFFAPHGESIGILSSNCDFWPGSFVALALALLFAGICFTLGIIIGWSKEKRT